MLVKHKRPIAWIDVDTDVLRRPDDLLRSTADFTCYLRAFRYLVTFDPEQLPRLFVPSYLAFGYSERTVDFLNFAVELMESMPDVRATDDYFLQEALTQWEGFLSFGLLWPTTVVKSRLQDRKGGRQAYFLHGDSGNVKGSIDSVEQHKVGVLGKKRRKRVFNHAAREAMAEKDLEGADFFSKKVFELAPDDPRPFHQYTSFLIKTKQWEKLAAQVEARRNDPHYGEVAERAEFLGALARREWDEADLLLEKALRAKSPNVDMMKSRKVRAELDKRALEQGIPMEKRVKLWWMETPYPGNFGDAINPYIVEGLTGIPPKFSTKPDRTLAIGSIIKFAKPGPRYGVPGIRAGRRSSTRRRTTVPYGARSPVTWCCATAVTWTRSMGTRPGSCLRSTALR